MFRWLFQYWRLNVDNPSSTYGINLWFFINIRLLKTKLASTITYFILSLNNLSVKNLKIFYKTYTFEDIYMYLFSWFFFLIFAFAIFI